MVGFQTKLRHGEQTRVFRLIPGLERAEFARLGGLHRNTYLDAPRLLDPTLRLNAEPRLRFAGQITGCEGYVESAAIGFLAGCFASADQSGARFAPPPQTTALGALLAHVTGGHLSDDGEGPRSYQPMNINFGLFPPLNMRFRGRDKAREKKHAITARAKADLAAWLPAARMPDVAA
jgi:methylenetetrahydrofolate--tRNA-(uracil-5-)-methyltransferase